MAISNAKVVGEISSGFITIVLNPELTGTEAVNNTGVLVPQRLDQFHSPHLRQQHPRRG